MAKSDQHCDIKEVVVGREIADSVEEEEGSSGRGVT